MTCCNVKSALPSLPPGLHPWTELQVNPVCWRTPAVLHQLTSAGGIQLTTNDQRQHFSAKHRETRWCFESHLFLQQQAELLPAVLHPESVCAVHHPHQPVRALKVVPPVGAQRPLTPDIPNIQLKSGKNTGFVVKTVVLIRP